LFDDYAPRFNAHLVRELSYRGPELIAAVLELDAVAPKRKFRRALDVGCGSGLAGAALRARCEVLVGVDISPKMIREAARTKLYDELRISDFIAFLDEQLEGEADLVIAADVFVYVGDLAPAFTAIARALTSDGILAFTVETEPGEAFGLGETLRFRHSRAHVERALAAAGLDPILLQDAWARKEAGAPVPGFIAVASPSGSPR
jgi:predicted TPR repeat methyltransferase